jgi:short-subunit dehydrogenase
MRWDGSVAVVTGASRGIGRAVAVAAAARGARLGLIARSSEELAQLAAGLTPAAVAAAADVADATELRAAIARIEATLGPPDILVNAAGIGAYGPVLGGDLETVERLLRVNVLGPVAAIQAVLPGMVSRRRGHIVNVASISGRIPTPLEAAYSASKAALVAFSEALALELAGTGVGVTIVTPGPVATGFFAARGAPYALSWPRPQPADRVARAIVTAVEAGRREVVIPGWLTLAVALGGVAPALVRWGTRRRLHQQLAAALATEGTSPGPGATPAPGGRARDPRRPSSNR